LRGRRGRRRRALRRSDRPIPRPLTRAPPRDRGEEGPPVEAARACEDNDSASATPGQPASADPRAAGHAHVDHTGGTNSTHAGTPTA
jgi:hypothetical protein